MVALTTQSQVSLRLYQFSDVYLAAQHQRFPFIAAGWTESNQLNWNASYDVNRLKITCDANQTTCDLVSVSHLPALYDGIDLNNPCSLQVGIERSIGSGLDPDRVDIKIGLGLADKTLYHYIFHDPTEEYFGLKTTQDTFLNTQETIDDFETCFNNPNKVLDQEIRFISKDLIQWYAGKRLMADHMDYQWQDIEFPFIIIKIDIAAKVDDSGDIDIIAPAFNIFKRE